MGSGRSTNGTAGVAIDWEECTHRSATKPYKLCVKTKRLHLIWLRVSAVASFISSALIGSLIRTSRYTHTDPHEWTHQIKTPPPAAIIYTWQDWTTVSASYVLDSRTVTFTLQVRGQCAPGLLCRGRFFEKANQIFATTKLFESINLYITMMRNETKVQAPNMKPNRPAHDELWLHKKLSHKLFPHVANTTSCCVDRGLICRQPEWLSVKPNLAHWNRSNDTHTRKHRHRHSCRHATAHTHRLRRHARTYMWLEIREKLSGKLINWESVLLT